MSEAGKSGLPLNQIIQGDCIDVMKAFPENSVDCIATDPPYGLSFMGNDWDKAVPSGEIWRECLRVLKDGAFAFILCIPRQDCLARMIVCLQDAGFNTAFTSLYWAYATGFPKAGNISRAVSKRMGEPVKEGVGFKTAGEYGDRNLPNPTPQGKERELMRHNPQTLEAKSLDGSYGGFQPKPAVEVIIVAMKPLSEKTYVEQALKNGKGVTWLDGGRIPTPSPIKTHGKRDGTGSSLMWSRYVSSDGYNGNIHEGRFPANLLVSDGVLDNGVITKSTGGKSGHTSAYGGGYKEEYYGGVNPGLGDSGSFSRYFDLDAWWDKQIQKLPENVRKTFPFLIVPKASKGERDEGCEVLRERVIDCLEGSVDGTFNKRSNHRPSIAKNFHPTVKPLKLMSYLVTLGSREGDVVLDPFIGSGTTALACEMLNRRWIGVEINSEYCKIAEARVRPWLNQSRLGEVDVFG